MPSLPKSRRPRYLPKPKQRHGNNSPNAKLYTSTRWRKYTRNFRRAETVEREGYGCEVCYHTGHMAGAEITDHIQPISAGGAIWDSRNHMALCRQCHQVKRSREAHGFNIDTVKGTDGLIPADRTQVYPILYPHHNFEQDNE